MQMGVGAGPAGHVVALLAIGREHGRAPTVFAALAPRAFALGFADAELVGGAPTGDSTSGVA